MALSTYAELKASVASWLERSDMTTVIVDCVTLAEARLNRELGAVEVDGALTGVVDSRELDISALSIVEPIELWVADPGSEDEREVQMQSPSTMAYDDTSGPPQQWVMATSSALKLDRPCDQAYAFRFHYRQRFALSDSATTNWLLTNHPDIYLAACLMWGAGYQEAFPNGSVWKSILDEQVPAVAHTLAKQRKGTLRVDPGLARIGRRSSFNYTTGV
jgi:hypothetical protein